MSTWVSINRWHGVFPKEETAAFYNANDEFLDWLNTQPERAALDTLPEEPSSIKEMLALTDAYPALTDTTRFADAAWLEEMNQVGDPAAIALAERRHGVAKYQRWVMTDPDVSARWETVERMGKDLEVKDFKHHPLFRAGVLVEYTRRLSGSEKVHRFMIGGPVEPGDSPDYPEGLPSDSFILRAIDLLVDAEIA
jgi:hypothetical protein